MHRSFSGATVAMALLLAAAAAPAAAQARTADMRPSIAAGISSLRWSGESATGLAVDGNMPLFATDALVLSAVAQTAFESFFVFNQQSFMGGGRVASIARGRLSLFGQFVIGRTRFALDSRTGCGTILPDCNYWVTSWAPGGGANIALTDRLQARAQIDYVKHNAPDTPGSVRFWFGVALPLGRQ